MRSPACATTCIQFLRAAGKIRSALKGKSIGLRINPECSTQEDHAIYDPCAPGSRLGVTAEKFRENAEHSPQLLEALDGLHFHTLCEQNSDDLERTLAAVEEKFGQWLPRMKWLNMGGGHHITRADYDIDRLERCIRRMQERYGVEVYLEPGEAVALNAGYLATQVLDVVGKRYPHADSGRLRGLPYGRMCWKCPTGAPS